MVTRSTIMAVTRTWGMDTDMAAIMVEEAVDMGDTTGDPPDPSNLILRSEKITLRFNFKFCPPNTHFILSMCFTYQCFYN